MPRKPTSHATAASAKAAESKAARAWQRMLSGRRLDLLDPSPLDVEIEDIAHGLARVARWNGQTKGDYVFSVAQHSLLVEQMARTLSPGLGAQEQLCILLHDAAEYVIGDMISPFKNAWAWITANSKTVCNRQSICASDCRQKLPPRWHG